MDVSPRALVRRRRPTIFWGPTFCQPLVNDSICWVCSIDSAFLTVHFDASQVVISSNNCDTRIQNVTRQAVFAHPYRAGDGVALWSSLICSISHASHAACEILPASLKSLAPRGCSAPGFSNGNGTFISRGGGRFFLGHALPKVGRVILPLIYVWSISI